MIQHTAARDRLLLAVRGMTVTFGGLTAVSDLSFEVYDGEIVSIIGPNGAGKTTAFNLITGMHRADSGSVLLEGRELAELPANKIAEAGIARTFQNIRVFPQMSVLDNVLVGAHTRLTTGPLGAIVRPPAVRRQEREARERALELLGYFGERLTPRRHDMAMSLSYANRRRTEIARALASQPKVLLLDEPAAGMNPSETREMAEQISQIRDRGFTVLLIEHDMHVVMTISDRVIVMDHGAKIAEGLPADIANNKLVIEAYLGRRGAEAEVRRRQSA
ncbi:MAG: ABC transporter ATP-binding protein [Chloroflexi bacterium]|nr:ABC transporter ATP-binding protein [Chloroflexota bacterium]